MKDIKKQIEKLRHQLEEVVKDKGTTDDLEVISASKTMEKVFHEFHEGLKRRAKVRKHRLEQLFDRRKGGE